MCSIVNQLMVHKVKLVSIFYRDLIHFCFFIVDDKDNTEIGKRIEYVEN